eukprot:609441-Karenia_brevis.AAC.1
METPIYNEAKNSKIILSKIPRRRPHKRFRTSVDNPVDKIGTLWKSDMAQTMLHQAQSPKQI